MSEENKEKVDYSSTLNLPNTDFPMRGGLPQKEPDILKDVIDNGLYEDVLKKNEGHDHFILHDGPPYANGEIHAGHKRGWSCGSVTGHECREYTCAVTAGCRDRQRAC